MKNDELNDLKQNYTLMGSCNFSEYIIGYTASYWSAQVATYISPECSREMVENISGFVNLLATWDTQSSITASTAHLNATIISTKPSASSATYSYAMPTYQCPYDLYTPSYQDQSVASCMQLATYSTLIPGGKH